MTDDPNEALERLLRGLTEALRDTNRRAQRQHEMEEQSQAATEFARHRHDGVAVPMAVEFDGIPEHLRDLAHGLLMEQARASLFLGQLDRAHPYWALFTQLKEAWENAATVGALQIARHNIEHHGEGLALGPEEFSASWGSIAVSAVLGAVRYGQEHPDALKGLEGLPEGAIDDTVARLVAWAAAEHGKGGEAAPEQA